MSKGGAMFIRKKRSVLLKKRMIWVLFFIVVLAPTVYAAQGYTTRVSVSSAGEQGNYESRFSFISSDGRYIAFESYASNLVTEDTNGTRDIFVHDREMGETTRVSVSSEGVQGNGSYSRESCICSER